MTYCYFPKTTAVLKDMLHVVALFFCGVDLSSCRAVSPDAKDTVEEVEFWKTQYGFNYL